MSNAIIVRLNHHDKGSMYIKAELLEDRHSTVLVRLPDGRVIIRKKKRDIGRMILSNDHAT